VASLRSLAVLDFEAGLYAEAIMRLERALERDSDDGLCWFYLGASRLRLGEFAEAKRCGYRTVRCPGTAAIGYDLVGRAAIRSGDPAVVEAFRLTDEFPVGSQASEDRWNLTIYFELRARNVALDFDTRATPFVSHAILGLRDAGQLAQFAKDVRASVGEPDFEMLELGLQFAELGLFEDAARVVQATCVDEVPAAERSFLPLYYLAWFAAQRGDATAARQWLAQAGQTRKDRVFASRVEEVEILRYAVQENPADAQAHLQLGCLLADLGRVDEASAAWQTAAKLDPQQSIAWRNLGLAAAAKDDLVSAEASYRKAIAARPSDQTLYRDLAEILTAAGRQPDAIRLLEEMPIDGMRRAEITVMLAEAYVAQQRYDDCLRLLEATPYFVNWEGQDVTWRLFNRSHIERGRQRLQQGDEAGALADFEAALTYPANLNVGRSNKPQEAPAQFWRGQALAALGRQQEARAAWQTGAGGADVPGEQNEYREKCRQTLGQ
jgi:tetratricopeptide (TPR) repeat protein